MMKKGVLLGMFALLSLGLQAQFTLDAELRPRTEFRNGFKTLTSENVDPAFFVSQRTRLNTTYKSEKYKFYLSIQDIRTWGDVKQLNVADRNGLTLHQAWGQVYFNPDFSVKVGRQEIIYDDHRMFGNVGWAQQARSHDALLFKYAKNKFKFDLGLAFNQESESVFETTYALAGNYKSIQYAWLHQDWSNFNASFLFLNNGLQYLDDSDADNNEVRYSQTLGTHLNWKISNSLKLTSNLYYQTGKDRANRDLSAYLIGLEANYKPSHWFGGLGFEMQSGTDNGISNENNSFTPFFGTNHKFNGFMDYFYVGNHANNVGLVDLYAKIGTALSQKSMLTLFVHNFAAQAKLLNPDNTEASQGLGTELDVVYNYKIAKDVALTAGYSQMFGTDSMELLKGGDASKTNNWAWVMLTIKPTLFTNNK